MYLSVIQFVVLLFFLAVALGVMCEYVKGVIATFFECLFLLTVLFADAMFFIALKYGLLFS